MKNLKNTKTQSNLGGGTLLADTLEGMSLSHIAQVIRRDWKQPYFGAKPYLDAMSTMTTVGENFGSDNGQSIVLYFLSNASTWRGPVARAVKAELKRRTK